MELDEKIRQDATSDSDGHPESFPFSNNSATQEWLTPASGEVASDSQFVGDDKKLAELIIKDMQLYHEIVYCCNFKTDQLHINLMAAVNNFHEAQDDVIKEEFLEKSKVHRDIPTRVDYDGLAPYFLYQPKQVIQKTWKYDSIGKGCNEHSVKTTLEKLFPIVEAP